jgi:uncharacterized protein (TIGR03083 family)
MTDRVHALRSSVEHLRSIVDRIASADHTSSAYPTEWSIADTLSHLGSSAVIMRRNLEDAIGRSTPDAQFNQSVWDDWNSKAPAGQVADALLADEALLESLESITKAQRNDFRFLMGPLNLDFNVFVGLRLNEHALHTWDVEVTLDPRARLSSEAAGEIIDTLHIIVRFAGKANGETKELRIRTVDPSRDFTLVFTGDSVSLDDAEHDETVDCELPAEAFVRLIYGRLDVRNAPAGINELHLVNLLKAFPGI